jgi:antitoxin (DNA-binding transcriptional repressor) of toxin-antitoxin stability system
MSFRSDDIVPMNQVRARFTELAAQVRRGREKLITRNGESCVALIEEATRGLADVEAGRISGVAELRARYRTSPKRRR